MGLGVRLLQTTALSTLAACLSGAAVMWYVAAGAFVLLVGRTCYYQMTAKANPPPSPPVPAGKLRICVSGYTHSAPTAKAHYLADLIAKRFPDKFESWYYFDQYAFHKFTVKKFDTVPFPEHLKGHSTSPFVWFETGANNKIEPIGGSDDLSKWAIATFPAEEKITALAKENWMSIKPYITGKSYHCDEGRPIPSPTFDKKL